MSDTIGKAIITLDVGTSSLRASLYMIDGELLHFSQFHYCPTFLGSNRVEQDPHIWDNAILFTLHELSRYLDQHIYDVLAISITSQRASIIPVDKEGTALYPAIMWQDKRSIAESERFASVLSQSSVYKKTGLRIDSYFSAPKIMWLQKHERKVFDATYKFVGVQDYIVHKLTDNFITDASQASRTLMMDLASRIWDDDLLSVVGIEASQLCEILEPGSIGGYLTGAIEEKIGLPAGIPVILAGGDQPCAAMSLGMIKEGVVVANTGTGSFTLGFSTEPKFDDQELTLCSVGSVPGSYSVEAGLITSGILVQWFVEQFFQEVPLESAFNKVFKDIASSPVGANGVVVLPHFKGVAAPYWNPKAKGLFFNITLSTTRSDMARSILEGLCLDMAQNLALIKRNIGKIDKIAIAGGMTKRDVFNQMQADVYNQDVWIANTSEASSLGAWMSAMVGIGAASTYREVFDMVCSKNPVSFHPNPESVLVYTERKRQREELYSVLEKGNVYNSFC